MDYPLENMLLEYIENLTVLEIGENRINSWNKTLLNKNSNLKKLKMPRNGRDIFLSEAMISDMFENTQLESLDLSGNTFICVDEVGIIMDQHYGQPISQQHFCQPIKALPEILLTNEDCSFQTWRRSLLLSMGIIKKYFTYHGCV